MASLFGKNKLRDLARQISNDQIQDHLKVIQAWCDDYHQGSLKKDKETSREQAYNRDIFLTVLGYREKPEAPYTFEPKATTEKRQQPDALISHTDTLKGIQNIAAVVELKGASIALDRPQQREGNMSPVQQSFKYKSQYRSCPFVIVSNFYELRLYNDTQLDYVRWTLDDLVDPAEDYLKFKTFYVLLHADNFTAASGPSKTEDLLSDIRQEQEEIGKKFYAAYQAARTALLKDVWKNNPNTRFQFELAIQKTQTIIDRIIFACFADDRGLLPDDIVARVVAYADKSPYEEPLIDHLKAFFRAIDKGSSRLGIPDGYNGGLFAEDKWIDALKISDAPLRRLTDLTKYDFKEDLSVNVLGHIFEQSITDLEDIKRKLANDKSPFDVQLPEPKVGKRKKEGIFYTPDYIVRHIVDATLGEFLRTREAEVLAKHGLTGRLGEKGYEKRERSAYMEYQTILQSIRVLDPACGSGAFLVYVFDYLLLENSRVDTILGGTLTSLEDFVRSILLDNIFGVDLNEESVEITKLSLWLKTAQKGKQLTALDANIKSGNSLIHDADIDAEAFDWQKHFPEVFKDGGGFDVVLGNPPYVQLSQITTVSDNLRKYLVDRYGTSGGRLNTYVFFIILGLRLLRPAGRLGFIVPNTLLTQDGYKGARKIVLDEADLSEIVQYPEMPFEDATVENISLIAQKTDGARGRKRSFDVTEQTARSLRVTRTLDQVPYLTAKNHIFALRGDAVTAQVDALPKVFEIGDYFNVNQAIALKGDRSLSIHDTNPDGHFYKVLDGRHIAKYEITWGGNWLEYVLERIHSCKRQDIFEADEKLLFRRTGTSLVAAYDDQQYYALNTLVVITNKPDSAPPLSLKALLAIFNSSPLNHYYGRKYKSTKTVFSEIQARSIQGLPIPARVSRYDAQLARLSDKVMALRSSITTDVASAADYICRVHGVERGAVVTAVRSDDWRTVDGLFAKLPIKSRQEVLAHLAAVWKEQEAKFTEVEELLRTIDTLVADLYGLTPDMRELVGHKD